MNRDCMTIINCKKQITDMKVKTYCINEVLKLLNTESVAKADNPLKTGFVSVESKAGNYVKRGSALRHITLFAALALAVAAMPALTSCEKEKSINSGVQSGEKITLYATSELPDTDTKTSLGNSNVVNWTTGDTITTFWGDNTNAAEFTLSTGGGTTSATFNGTPTETTEECYAIYPHNAATTINASKTISFTLPATQTYKADGFAEGANPMVAYKSAAGKLQFKNLCAVLKLQLKVASGTKTIKKITISSATKKLSGKATVAMTYGVGVPTIAMATGDSAINTVTLDCSAEVGGGVTLTTEATAFYIVVPATSSDVTDNSFKVGIETTTGGALKSVPNIDVNRFNRAKIVKMPEYSYTDVATAYTENGKYLGAGILIGTTIWAPVNCGYEPATTSPDYKGYPYGKLYQWGRKDGQGYKDDTYEDATYPSGDNIVTGTVDLTTGQNTANAEKFYKNSSYPYDWLSPKNDALWNSGTEAAPVKTLYDPCPAGWRVPTNTELYALIGNADYKGNWTTVNSQNGRWFDGTTGTTQTSGVFLPAAGARYTDGTVTARNYFGKYYSSTPTDSNVYFLLVESDDARMAYYSRAYGLSVRCVKE